MTAAQITLEFNISATLESGQDLMQLNACNLYLEVVMVQKIGQVIPKANSSIGRGEMVGPMIPKRYSFATINITTVVMQ